MCVSVLLFVLLSSVSIFAAFILKRTPPLEFAKVISFRNLTNANLEKSIGIGKGILIGTPLKAFQ